MIVVMEMLVVAMVVVVVVAAAAMMVMVSQISPLSLLKCGLTAPKIAKIGIFWYKFGQKGYTPISDFYKIWLGEGCHRFAP